eukprot:COSAG05_NODE_258_length_12741_cov_168.778279_7_plen_80_part_00
MKQDRAQYQQIAEANRIVLLFPKPLKNASSAANHAQRKACFDSWGDAGPDYALRSSVQMAAIARMTRAIVGSTAVRTEV